MMKITIETFETLIETLHIYLNVMNRPSPQTTALWFKEISNLPESDVVEAFRLLRASVDAIPKNLPKAIKVAVFDIEKSKCVEKGKIGDYGKCDDCNGCGVFKILIKVDKKWSEPIIFCGSCDNWRLWTNNPEKRITREELERTGIRFKPYNKVLMTSIPVTAIRRPVSQVRSLADQLAELKRLEKMAL